MKPRFTQIAQTIRNAFGSVLSKTASTVKATGQHTAHKAAGARNLLLTAAVVAGAGYMVWTHPPVHNVARGDVAIRTNQLTGGFDEFREGSMLLLPGLHEVRTFSLRDQVYQPAEGSKAGGSAAFQSVEGMSLGVDMTVRYALDKKHMHNCSVMD